MSRLQLAIDQIVFAREYTLRLLNATEERDWFRMPAEGVTHVAWQVGHLAMAEYRLCMERIRGARPEDADLISTDFIRPFAGASKPVADPGYYPPLAELRAVFERVHRQLLRELPGLSEEELDLPPLRAHPIAKTKFQSLMWCGQHEMLHAGQIGLLRRLLGKPPQW